MNYKIIFRDTLRLFRESKPLRIFGIIAFVCEVIFRVSVYSIENPPVPWIAYPLFFLSLYFSLLAKCGLIYLAYWGISKEHPTLVEAWHFCKTKIRSIIWLYFLGLPLVMFAVFIVVIVALSEISTSLTWMVDILVSSFLASLLILSIGTMVIHNLEAGLALWIGLLIVVNNFFHVAILNSILLILHIVLNLSIGNALPGIFLIVPFTVTMTLAFRVFVTKGTYPGLSNIQPTA